MKMNRWTRSNPYLVSSMVNAAALGASNHPSFERVRTDVYDNILTPA